MRIARNLLLFTVGAAAVGGVSLWQRGSFGLATGLAQEVQEADAPLAPELDGAVAWLNTDHPIRMAELKGRVVILDFWTYGCINCMHMLPVLRQLEAQRAGQPLEVIGVHSAKFENEKATAHVRAAVERYGITHPVAVDSEMAIWDRYGVQAWPTLVVIRPDGRVAGSLPGEVPLAVLDRVVGKVMEEARAKGALAAGPALPHRTPAVDQGELAYPGKVIAGPDGRIYISDSRHHRVVIAAADGRILETLGSGVQGRRDGSFETAQLDDPQGLALSGHTLYVADARGYVVLRADLTARTVTTLAGTGKLGQAPLGGAVTAATADLRSPWDLLLDRDQLYVAMAGSHQIGVIDLKPGQKHGPTLARFAGSGREAIQDGEAAEAAFAQPSGLSLAGRTLYVADSESSGVRAIDLKTRRTRTLLGTGLFDWGDGEGAVRPKLIQHPLAVAATGSGLWIADTYNNKLKMLSGDGTHLRTVLTGAAGKPLLEPSGLWVEPDGALLIADTGNGRILRLPPGASAAVVVPVGRRDAAPETAAVVKPAPAAGSDVAAQLLQPQELGTGRRDLELVLLAPEGFAFSDGAPYRVELQAGTGALELSAGTLSGEARAGSEVRVIASANVRDGDGLLTATVHANICDAVNHAACYPVRGHYAVPIKGLAIDHAARLTLPLSVPGSKPHGT